MRGAIVLVAMLLTASAWAQSPDISARRLLSGWKAEDPSMRMLAEVIASAFASGLSWSSAHGGREVYCAPPDLKGQEVMIDFEKFLQDHPDEAEKPYGDAMAASLSRAFPCPTH
jgi:Rap1a immunity proteins